MAVQNKFIEMLKNKPKSSSKIAQTIVPGIKKRGDCASGCLILKNCQNLNKRLIALVLQYREGMNKISIFTNNRRSPNSRRDDSYEFTQGYDQCNDDIKQMCRKLITREEENIIDIHNIMRESYSLITEIENNSRGRGTYESRKARELRIRYDAFFKKLKGDVGDE